MKTVNLIPAFVLIIFASLSFASAQVVYDPPEKKLIDFCQHSPLMSYYKDNILNYEKGPFDGITLRLSKEVGGGNIFMVDDWAKVPAERKEAEMKLAASLPESTVLTDNFLALFGASQMDWFSDDDWAKAEEYIRFGARIAKAAHCEGILWDAEPYKPGKNPWKFSDQEKVNVHSFEEYYAQIRKRGAQFIRALQEEYPGVVIFSLRELSDFQQGSPFSAPIFPVTDKMKAVDVMKDAWWGMHIPFYVGIMEGISTDATFIDGNEEAYFYTSPLEYYMVRSVLMDEAKALLPTDLWSKHTASFRLGHAIAPEYIQGNWLGLKPFPYRLSGQGAVMSKEDRIKWLEHNTYYALRSSDRYAWTWAEGIDWWTGDQLPEGFKDALLSAKKKVAGGQPLGFDIEEMIRNAQDKAEKFYKDKKE
jgi:hypothetical protein